MRRTTKAINPGDFDLDFDRANVGFCYADPSETAA